MQIGVRKTIETKVIRTEYELAFKEGMKAQGLKVYLGQIPDDASFLELREGDGDETILVFRGEAQEGL